MAADESDPEAVGAQGVELAQLAGEIARFEQFPALGQEQRRDRLLVAC